MVEVANKDPGGQPAAVIQLNIDARAGRAIAEYIRPAGALEHAQAAIIARERKRNLAGGDCGELVILAGGEGKGERIHCPSSDERYLHITLRRADSRPLVPSIRSAGGLDQLHACGGAGPYRLGD